MDGVSGRYIGKTSGPVLAFQPAILSKHIYEGSRAKAPLLFVVIISLARMDCVSLNLCRVLRESRGGLEP